MTDQQYIHYLNNLYNDWNKNEQFNTKTPTGIFYKMVKV